MADTEIQLANLKALTKNETDSVTKLRSMLKPDTVPECKYQSDRMMLRYLQVTKFDFKKAATLLLNYGKYHRENDMPSIYTEVYPTDFYERFKSYIGGSDSVGRPLFVIPSAGSWNVRRAIENGQEEMFMRYVHRVAQIFEKELLRRDADYGVLLADVSGIALGNYCHKRTLEVLIRLVRIYESCSPGAIGKVYLVNASKLGLALLNTVNSIVRISCPIVCFDTNEEVWKAKITEEIPNGHPHFGGNSTDFTVI